MTRKDYIEKITQNLEHLTKDELKDVSILTTAQLGVRSKFSERQQLEKEIANLKSQLQQQALPVVPECVGKYIEDCKENRYALNIALDLMVKEYASRKTELSTWVMNNQEQFAKAWFGKYEVEKPKLFYLKHIDMSRVDETHDWFILRHGNLGHSPFCKGELPYYCNNAKYTQKEIGSMKTGSYEQIEVAE